MLLSIRDRADFALPVSGETISRRPPRRRRTRGRRTVTVLVVGWFGDDLRAGHCTVRPKVEVSSKTTTPDAWKVHGITRGGAAAVSTVDGRPAYGGTPSDDSVVRAVRDLKTRGFSVIFYPFLFMDIATGNTLPDPWTGGAGQPVYPWRGRITYDPAPGQPKSVDTPSATPSIRPRAKAGGSEHRG